MFCRAGKPELPFRLVGLSGRLDLVRASGRYPSACSICGIAAVSKQGSVIRASSAANGVAVCLDRKPVLLMTHASETPTPPADVTIRRAIPGDLPALGRLGTLLVKTHHDFDPRRFIPPTRQTPAGYASFLGTQLEAADVVVLVAVQDEQVVGYTYAGVEGQDWMSLRGPAGVLYDIVVDPDRRRHGVGRMLFDATVALLESLGASQVVLSTAERNDQAQRLFASAGFRRTMIEMTRDLDAGDSRG